MSEFKTTPMVVGTGATLLGLKSNGTVWSSGVDNLGALGRSIAGRFDYNPSPVSLEGDMPLCNIDFIDAHRDNGIAVDHDGSVWIWGSNSNGQLGTGRTDTQAHSTPSKLPGIGGTGELSGVKKALISSYLGCALLDDGSVCYWGSNVGETAPVAVTLLVNKDGSTLKNIIDIAIVRDDGAHNAIFALTSSGQVLARGGYSYCGTNQTGDYVAYPTPVVDQSGTPLSNISKIGSCVALKNDGTVWVWGQNGNGQLGNGDQYAWRYFAAPANIENVSDIFCDDYNLRLIKTVKGEMYVWGANVQGALGVDSLYLSITSPTKVDTYDDAVGIYAGSMGTFYKSDATVWGLGQRANELANNGLPNGTHIPQQVFHDDGTPFLLWEDGEGPDPGPDPDPDPKPGECRCKCCGPRVHFDIPVNGKYTDSIRRFLDEIEETSDESCQ